MEQLDFSYQGTTPYSEADMASLQPQLDEELTRLMHASGSGYADDRASINLPSDADALRSVKQVIEEKKRLNLSHIIVVGIGGSNLGTIAVQEAVLGRLYNQHTEGIKILYADTVDASVLADIIRIIEPSLEAGRRVILNGVSKSGGTTETIANLQVLIEYVKGFDADYKEAVVVTTDRGSRFWDLAAKEGFSVLEIPRKVGGRYSVFSPVGLFPLGLIGADIDSLLKGAEAMRRRCLQASISDNPAMQSAALLKLNLDAGHPIADQFLFASDLESVGKWYRQLMGESVGKEHNLSGKQVFSGMTPTVSIGSTDLHSMAQLYLGGPKDKYTTFVRIKNDPSPTEVPSLEGFGDLVGSIQGKTIHSLMDAILQGVQAAFSKGRRPYSTISLPAVSAETIGQLLQMKMMEMMFLGALMGVNPFDQPNVEEYKIETKRILKEQDSR
ncbi:MAG: hypothetical protein ABIC95_01620 [archaeon]